MTQGPPSRSGAATGATYAEDVMKTKQRIPGWSVLQLLFAVVLLGGCTSVTIDEYRQGASELTGDSAVVVIGRRNGSDYETEPDLVSCIGDVLSSGPDGIPVIPESEFVDKLYPWFEPRTAPMKVKDLNRLLDRQELAQAMDDYNIHYFIWIDGNTETTSSAGSITCSIAAGGAGCLGFGTWDKESKYEASIWDKRKQTLIGKIKAGAEGTSFMPAIVVPIPLIARVQSNACKEMGAQLRSFLRPPAPPQ